MEINDLDALAAAAKALGLEFVKDQKTYHWYGQKVGDYANPDGFTDADFGKCEHALRIKGNASAYEVGVIKRRDGKPGYVLLWDFWNGGRDLGSTAPGLQAKIGKDGQKLKQQYAVQIGTRWAQKNGMRVAATVRKDGTVVLRAS